MTSSHEAGSCFALLEEDILRIGNTCFEESWRIRNGRLFLIAFQRTGGDPWIAQEGELEPACPSWITTLETQRGLAHPCESPSLRATLAFSSGTESRKLTLQVFPEIPGSILHVLRYNSEPRSHRPHPEHEAGGIEQDEKGAAKVESSGLLAPIWLAGCHYGITETHFTEQSDIHANFVHERSWMTHPSEKHLRFQSNLISIENPASKEGLLFLFLAPSRLVRDPWSPSYDCEIATCGACSTQNGFGVHASLFPGHYPLVKVAYRGGAQGRTQALHALQRALHPRVPGRDGVLLSNTWGDRGRADRMSEAFALREIEAAARLGVEVVQLDDGWQKGRTANTVARGGVWNGFWSMPDFWEPDPERFPRGLAPVTEAAKGAGVALGLWFAPDSTGDFNNWEKDAAKLVELWERHGVRFFKLDAIKLHSALAEKRCLAILDRVHAASGGSVLFDLDATAEHRPTYWGHPHGSTLFLENRYTDWGNYYPHQTLKALWSLAHYVWPQRLRLEFLNPARNEERYGTDPLRPAAYPPETLFAITMPASPLAWLENTGLPDRVRERLKPLIALWKEHRDRWHAGRVFPIGQEPDGWNWTGFVSITGSDQRSYALLFRERNNAAQWEFCLPQLPAHRSPPALLAGQGKLEWRQESLVVEIPQPLGFVFAQL